MEPDIYDYRNDAPRTISQQKKGKKSGWQMVTSFFKKNIKSDGKDLYVKCLTNISLNEFRAKRQYILYGDTAALTELRQISKDMGRTLVVEAEPVEFAADCCNLWIGMKY